MDLWDVIRLMVRRWYVSAPMLVLTMAAVVGTAVTVSPNYTAEAQVMVLPPSSQGDSEPGEDRVVNPWDVNSLAGAIVTMLRNHNLVEQLDEEGFRAAWEAGTDLQFQSVIVITVTSPTEHEATMAAERLLQAVNDEVSVQQASFDIPESEKISTVVLGAGENVEVVRGGQVRAMVVVLAAFLILTIGVTIAFDAVARRRVVGRTAPGDGAAAPSSPAPPYAGLNGAHAGERAPLGSPHPVLNGRDPATAPAAGGGGGGGGTVYTAQTSRSEQPAEAPPAVDDRPETTTKAPIQISYRPPQSWPVTARPSPESGALPPEADDSTVVLPLSGTARRPAKKSRGDNEGNESRDRGDARASDQGSGER